MPLSETMMFSLTDVHMRQSASMRQIVNIPFDLVSYVLRLIWQRWLKSFFKGLLILRIMQYHGWYIRGIFVCFFIQIVFHRSSYSRGNLHYVMNSPSRHIHIMSLHRLSASFFWVPTNDIQQAIPSRKVMGNDTSRIVLTSSSGIYSIKYSCSFCSDLLWYG